MNAELPPFMNGEHNSQSASTLDCDITPLKEQTCSDIDPGEIIGSWILGLCDYVYSIVSLITQLGRKNGTYGMVDT